MNEKEIIVEYNAANSFHEIKISETDLSLNIDTLGVENPRIKIIRN